MNTARVFISTAAVLIAMVAGSVVADDGSDNGAPTFFGIPIVTDDDEESLEQRRERARRANEERGHRPSEREDAADRPRPTQPTVPEPEREPEATEPAEPERAEASQSEPPRPAVDPSRVRWRTTAAEVPDPLQLPDPYLLRGQATGNRVVQLATTLRLAYQCRQCDGETEITRRVEVGRERLGANTSRAVYENRVFTCPRCEGDGYGSGRAINRLLANLTVNLGRIRLEDPHHADALRRTHGILIDVLDKDIESLAARLNPVNVEVLQRDAQRGNIFGSPLVALGEVVAVGTLPETDLLVVGMATEGSVAIVSDLKLANEPVVGEIMLFGGVISGFVEHSARAVPVVQHGYLVGRGAEAESLVDAEGFLKEDRRNFPAMRGVGNVGAAGEAAGGQVVGAEDDERIALRSIRDFTERVPAEFRRGASADEIVRLMRLWADDQLRQRYVTVEGGEVSGREVVGIEDGRRVDQIHVSPQHVFEHAEWQLIIRPSPRTVSLDEARRVFSRIERGGAWGGRVRAVTQSQLRSETLGRTVPTIIIHISWDFD